MKTEKGLANQLVQIPNLLTIGRFVLVPGLFAAFFWGNSGWVLVVLALVFGSDVLDGWLARRWKLTSLVGKVLDHAVDKFVIISLVLLLALTRDMPWWVFWFFLARESITSVVGIFLLYKKVKISGSNLMGKITGFFFGITSVAYIVAFAWREMFLWTTVGLAVLASFSYIYYHFFPKQAKTA